MAYNSKYTGQEVENLLDQVAEGGGTQVQANWQEWDTSSPSFVKNKPNIWQEHQDGNPVGPIVFKSPVSISEFDFDNSDGHIVFGSKGIHYTYGPPFDLSSIDIIHTGDGTKFLADDGTYKEVSGGGGGITSESDPIFSASPAFNITDEDIDSWNGKQDAISDLEAIRSGAGKGATAVQPEDIPSEVELITISGDMLADEPTYTTVEAQSIIDAYNANKLIAIKCGTRINFGKGWFIPNINIRTQSGVSQIFLSGILGNYYIEHRIIYDSSAETISASSQILIDLSESGGSSDESSNVIIVEDVPDYLSVSEAKTYRITRQVSSALTIAVETESYSTSTVIFETGDVAPSLLIENQAFWVNGNIPSIESYTVYELSLFHDERVGVMAVLSPFKLA